MQDVHTVDGYELNDGVGALNDFVLANHADEFDILRHAVSDVFALDGDELADCDVDTAVLLKIDPHRGNVDVVHLFGNTPRQRSDDGEGQNLIREIARTI